MAIETITAKANFIDKDTKENRSVDISCDYDFQDDVNAMIAEFTPDVVYHHAKNSLRVSLQSALRIWAQRGFLTNSSELEAEVNSWQVPSGRSRGISKVERLKEQLGKLPEAELSRLLEELQG